MGLTNVQRVVYDLSGAALPYSQSIGAVSVGDVVLFQISSRNQAAVFTGQITDTGSGNTLQQITLIDDVTRGHTELWGCVCTSAGTMVINVGAGTAPYAGFDHFFIELGQWSTSGGTAAIATHSELAIPFSSFTSLSGNPLTFAADGIVAAFFGGAGMQNDVPTPDGGWNLTNHPSSQGVCMVDKAVVAADSPVTPHIQFNGGGAFEYGNCLAVMVSFTASAGGTPAIGSFPLFGRSRRGPPRRPPFHPSAFQAIGGGRAALAATASQSIDGTAGFSDSAVLAAVAAETLTATPALSLAAQLAAKAAETLTATPGLSQAAIAALVAAETFSATAAQAQAAQLAAVASESLSATPAQAASASLAAVAAQSLAATAALTEAAQLAAVASESLSATAALAEAAALAARASLSLAAAAGFVEDGQANGQSTGQLSVAATASLSFTAQVAAQGAAVLAATPALQEAAQLAAIGSQAIASTPAQAQAALLAANAAALLSAVAALLEAASGGGTSAGPMYCLIEVEELAEMGCVLEVEEAADMYCVLTVEPAS